MDQSENNRGLLEPWGKLTCIYGDFPNISLQGKSYTFKVEAGKSLVLTDERDLLNSVGQIFKDDSETCWISTFDGDCMIELEDQKLGRNDLQRLDSGSKLGFYDQTNELLATFVFSRKLSQKDKNKLKREDQNNVSNVENKHLEFESDLLNELKCSACQKIIHDSTTLIPCLHSYCGLCLMQLLQKTQNCLVCGVESRNFTKDVFLNNLAEIYLEFNEEARGSKEEYKEIDRQYKEEGLVFAYASEFNCTWEGVWKNGRANGPGKLTCHKTGNISEGIWREDKMNGEGMATYSNGLRYQGSFKNDKPHGKGRLDFPDGTYCEAEWKDGYQEGRGKMVFSNGDVYEGSMKYTRIQGNGKMIYKNGDVYEGEWSYNVRYGQGKMLFANGDVYEGCWENNKMHGYGEMRYKDGSVFVGNWIQNNKVVGGENVGS